MQLLTLELAVSIPIYAVMEVCRKRLGFGLLFF